MSGEGKNEVGLYTDQIDEVMNKYRPEYVGCIARDEIKDMIPKVKSQKRIAMVINLDKSTKAGSHWTALMIDNRPNGSKTVEYFDSFGRECPPDILKDIKFFIEAMDPGTYLKQGE